MYFVLIGCEKNLIEVVVFGIKVKILRMVNEKFSKYIKFRIFWVDCGLIYGFV